MSAPQPMLPGMLVGDDWRTTVEQWSADMRERWEERAAIMEYDGGMSRATAEREAYLDVAGGAR